MTSTATHAHSHPPPPPSSSSASFRGCCCCLFLLFSLLALLVLAAALVIILAVKPRKPQFDLQQVDVVYVGVTPSSSSAAAVSLGIRLLFAAENGNRVGIEYRESTFTVMYRGVPLGRGAVPGFYQPAHSVVRIPIDIAVDRVSLLQANAADLVRDATLYDRVDFRVFGDAGANIRILGINTPTVQVSVDCAIGISPRRRALINKQCGFDGLTV